MESWKGKNPKKWPKKVLKWKQANWGGKESKGGSRFGIIFGHQAAD